MIIIMGRKLDKLLGRTFRVSKLKTFLGLAMARLAVLKNQRKVRWSQSRNDVVALLKLGHQDRALLRVEQAMKEQNMLDVLAMIEGYCELLAERGVLIDNQDGCPEELKEAISGLIFASSRYGEMPELMEIRGLFTIRYGKEFTSAAVELRNNCGVNHKLIQKMSTKQPSLENRRAALKEIADEQGITLTIQESSPPKEPARASNISNEPVVGREQFSGPMEERKYTDVATAALAAFQSAAQAAAAARAAVELSRYDQSQDDDSGDELPRTETPKVEQEYRHVRPEKDTSQEQEKEGQQFQQHQRSRSESEESSDDAQAMVQAPKSMVFDESDEGSEEESGKGNQAANPQYFRQEASDSFRLNLDRRPISVRTKKIFK